MTDPAREFGRLLLTLAEGFGFELSDVQSRVYAEALGDLTLEQLRAACAAALRESRYFPRPAELRGYVLGNATDAAVLAWAAFERAASAVGAYAPLIVEDECAAEALTAACGGWPEFCALEGGEAGRCREVFVAAYKRARVEAAHRGPRRLDGLGSPPAGPAAAVCWAGRLTAAGEVRAERFLRALEATNGMAGLPEGRAPADDDAPAEG